jgi:DNA-binding NtrC family response regulator
MRQLDTNGKDDARKPIAGKLQESHCSDLKSIKGLSPMKGKSILVVDDEQTVLNCLSRDLRSAGLEVTTATDGGKAIAKINSSFFDLVMTDLLMPVSDGSQVVKAAKQVDLRTMVIVLTGNGTADAAVDAFHLGADDFVQKPCDSDELLCRISNCFKKQELLKKFDRYEKLLPAWCHCKKMRNGQEAYATCRCPECYAEQMRSSLAGAKK